MRGLQAAGNELERARRERRGVVGAKRQRPGCDRAGRGRVVNERDGLLRATAQLQVPADDLASIIRSSRSAAARVTVRPAALPR